MYFLESGLVGKINGKIRRYTMPNRAYMYNKTENPVKANDVGIENRDANFICCTENCNAEMILCKAGTEDAYFRSKIKRDHVSASCIKNSIVFRPDTYDEELFDINFAFESMLGRNHTIQTINRGEAGVRNGVVGRHRRIRIHTLPMLYAMCISKDKNESYNGVLIDDILADQNNYNRYLNGIEGFKIVETSFYYYTDAEKSITLNYPLDNKGMNSWVKIRFEEEKLYKSQKSKLIRSLHIEPIIIAGEWTRTPEGSKHLSECVIHKKTQIYYAKL